ncbi:MAG: response regulator transcription factor [Bryobacterales bacterium]|nr:response regulator transcription factor [Bryobacterales bacterium]
MIRIGIFTDEPLAAMGLSSALAEERDWEIAGIWDDASILPALAEQTHPDVLLLDMACGLSLRQIAQLRQRAPRTMVVCWARTIQFDLAMNLLELGIRGVLAKTVSQQELGELIRRIAAGEHCIDDSVFVPVPAQTLRLTGRERQILTMVSLGMKNREMASALSISEGTLKVYVSRLLQKTGLRDRHQLALFRLRNPESAAPPPPPVRPGLALPSFAD